MKKGWEVKKIGDICLIKPPKNEARSRLNRTSLVSFVPMENLGINQNILMLFKPDHWMKLKEVILTSLTMMFY
jgi:hypothetical protein